MRPNLDLGVRSRWDGTSCRKFKSASLTGKQQPEESDGVWRESGVTQRLTGQGTTDASWSESSGDADRSLQSEPWEQPAQENYLMLYLQFKRSWTNRSCTKVPYVSTRVVGSQQPQPA